MRLPPRILLLSAFYHPFVGGVETHARELARYLAETGFGITVVTKRAPGVPERDTVDDVPVYRTYPAARARAFASGSCFRSPSRG